MIGNIDEILNKSITKLKEEYGEDFKLEIGDEFVFTLNNGVLIVSQEETKLGIKIILDTAIPLDMDFDLEEGGE